MLLDPPFAVVPVLVGPLQVLLTLLPAIFLAVASAILAALRPSAMKNTLRVLWRQKLQVAVVVALVCGIVWGGNWLWGKLRPAAAATEDARDWPTFRGGLSRLGAAERAVGPNGGALNWSWKQGSEAFFSSPTLVGNRLYVASATFGAFTSSGQIYCFDADTGAIAWKSAPSGYRPTFSSPVVSGNYLVCGEGLHTTRDSRVICLDLTPGNEGKTLWTFTTKSHVECTPVVYENRVFVGAGDDGYYCLELEPDAIGQARLVWHAPGEQYKDAETSLAVHDGKVYAGLGLGGKTLCVLDAATGRELHRMPMPYPVFSPPSISNGKLYVGMGNGDFANSAETLSQVPAGEVHCIDLATLQTDWTFKTADTVLGSVAIAGDQLYFGSRDGHLYALSRDGKLAGKWNSRGGIVASVAVTGQHVYVVNEKGMLFALDRQSLDPVWEFRLGAATSLLGTPLFISSPAVDRGRVYVGTQYDGLICAGEATSEKKTPVWPGYRGGPGAGGCLDGSPLSELGEVHWSFPPEPPSGGAEPLVVAPVAVQENRLLVPLAGGMRGLVCLPADSESKDSPRPLWRYPTQHGVVQSPAAVGKLVFLVDGRAGEKGRQLHCLTLSLGQVLWQAGLAPGASGVFSVGEERVWLQAAAGKLASLDLSGKHRWTCEVGELAHAPTAAGAMLIVAAVNPPTLMALDLPTGGKLWRVALPHAPVASPAVRGSTIYLATGAGLEARSLVDGAHLLNWKIEGGAATGDFALTRSHAAYVNAKGELVLLRREDGSVEKRVSGILPGSAPLVARDALLLATEFQLLRLPLDGSDEEPLEWLDITALGRSTAPPILHGGALYFGTSGRGLVRAGEPAIE